MGTHHWEAKVLYNANTFNVFAVSQCFSFFINVTGELESWPLRKNVN